MGRQIFAIAFIFACATMAWVTLGSTIFYRTFSTGEGLKGRVESTWGTEQKQTPPAATWEDTVTRTVMTQENERTVERTVTECVSHSLPLESSRVNVDLDLEHRQKGLRWYSTYRVAFSGTYTYRNPETVDRDVTFKLSYPASRALYDDLVLTVEGRPLAFTNHSNCASGVARVPAGAMAQLRVGYRSQGLDRWGYGFGGEVAQTRDFQLGMTTNFKRIDFPENTLSPTRKHATAHGWRLEWDYRNLVSGFEIGMSMPEKLQPGPLAGRISYFAPVSLFFFFFLMWIITTLRGIELHPMNYFFLAAAFFSFHLLMAYLVDHVSIQVAFAICSAVSIALVVSYLRLVVGMRFAAVEAGLAQLVYLVLFSYAFFFEGHTGLAITIGTILTLFVVMQMTGRIRWAEKFGRPAPAR